VQYSFFQVIGRIRPLLNEKSLKIYDFCMASSRTERWRNIRVSVICLGDKKFQLLWSALGRRL
jgi:hypothetical protein